MKTILIVFWCVTLSGCVTREEPTATAVPVRAPAIEVQPIPTSQELIANYRSVAKPSISTAQSKPATYTSPYTPKEPTPEDDALERARCKAYYSGLVASIRSLDDGVSSAESIARAAISENITLLKDWKRAQMAHLSRPSAAAANIVESSIIKLPGQGLIDEATSVVLRNRKKSQEATETPASAPPSDGEGASA